jgi:tetratricopeptide (TPR) repeat protein
MTQKDTFLFLELRPQPIGIFPLPAGYLVLPPADNCTAALAELLQGREPAEWPVAWEFYRLALNGDPAAALATLAGDESLLAQYNRLVLEGDPANYLALRHQAAGDLAALLELIAYVLGWVEVPPLVEATTGELQAQILSAKAAAALEAGALMMALEALQAAVETARSASPLLAAQLLADLAETRLAARESPALAMGHYREALQLLMGSGLAELRAQVALRLGTMYHEIARGQRGALLEAVKCYQEALRFYKAESHPEPYAMTQTNLALAYLAMPLTEASDRLRMAVAVQALRAAVAIYTPEAFPDRWAGARLNLANALQYVPSAHPEENLIEAVGLYEELLAARNPADDPVGYARLLANQGNALAHLGIFDHAQAKLNEATSYFVAAGEHEAAAGVQGVLAEIEERKATPAA